MPNTIDDLKKAIIDSVESRAKDFLDKNADAKDFLYDRAQRLAKLGFEYTLAADDAERAALKDDMELVKQTMENEISSIAVAAQTESKNLFKAILGTAMDTLIKVLPTVLAAI